MCIYDGIKIGGDPYPSEDYDFFAFLKDIQDNRPGLRDAFKKVMTNPNLSEDVLCEFFHACGYKEVKDDQCKLLLRGLLQTSGAAVGATTDQY